LLAQFRYIHVIIHTLLSESSCTCQLISPQPPPHVYRSTPNHSQSYVLGAQTISIYHVSPHQLHSEYPKDCTKRLCFLSVKDTPHIHLAIMNSVLSRFHLISLYHLPSSINHTSYCSASNKMISDNQANAASINITTTKHNLTTN